MIIDIPKQNKFSQVNDGELRGSLTRTFNVDLEEKRDKITLSRRLAFNTHTGDESGLTTPPTSWAFFDNRYFCIAGGTIYKSTVDNDITAPFVPDDGESCPTDLDGDEDLVVFNNRMYIIADSDIIEKGSNEDSNYTPGDISSAPDNGFHTTTIFVDRLYISNDENKIISMTTAESVSTSGDYTLDLTDVAGQDFAISSIRSASDGIWVATMNKKGGRAKIYFWNGVTADTPQNEYIIPDTSIKALVIHDDRPYIVTGRGLLMTFNGSYFEEIARFPFYEKLKYTPVNDRRINTWLYDNCIAVIDNKIHISIGNRPFDDFEGFDTDNSYAGIWVYDPEIGLYHKYAFTSDRTNGSNSKVQVDIRSPGAIFPAIFGSQLPEWSQVGKFVTGAQYYTNATETYAGIFHTTSAYGIQENNEEVIYPNVGWFVTAQIQAEQAIESWQNLILSFSLNSTDKIVAKCRTSEEDYQDATVTWHSPSQVSTTTDLSSIKSEIDLKGATISDYEITFIRGDGDIAQITSIDFDGTNYIINFDREMTGSATPNSSFTGPHQTSKARIQKWQYLGEITESELIYQKFATGQDSAWIQFKVVMYGYGDSPTIERLTSVSKAKVLYQ